jgi:hypothetical protein
MLLSIRRSTLHLLSLPDLPDAAEFLADIGTVVTRACGILLAVVWPYLFIRAATPADSVLRWAALGWTIFYYPLALLVSATTDSFQATVNPVSGLTLLHRIKPARAAFFAFYLLICAGCGALVVAVWGAGGRIFSASPAPVMLVASMLSGAVSGSVVFYSNLAVSYLAGRTALKCL